LFIFIIKMRFFGEITAVLAKHPRFSCDKADTPDKTAVIFMDLLYEFVIYSANSLLKVVLLYANDN
jgi:hypothetical protein